MRSVGAITRMTRKATTTRDTRRLLTEPLQPLSRRQQSALSDGNGAEKQFP